MSKFEELCQAAEDKINRWNQYRNDCENFAVKIVQGLMEYFEIPRTNIRYVIIDKEGKQESMPTLKHAMVFDSDTYWHLGIIITLSNTPDILQQRTLLARIKFKKKDKLFLIKLGNTKREFTVDESKKDYLILFYDFLFNEIINWYENNLEMALKEEVGYGFQ